MQDEGDIVLQKRSSITLSFNQPLISPHVTANINLLPWRPSLSPLPDRIGQLCSWRKELVDVDFDYDANIYIAAWLPEHIKKGSHQAVQAVKVFSAAVLPYFEVRVVELAKDGAISVGVAHRKMSLKGEMIGWNSKYVSTPSYIQP